MLFDERDQKLNERVTDEIKDSLEASIAGVWSENAISIHYEAIHNLPPKKLRQFVDLVDRNLGKFYVKHTGKPTWKLDKFEEMRESGLIYVWLTSEDNSIVGFMSFKLCSEDEDETVLYLYEIHIVPQFQALKLGGKLMQIFHALAKDLSDRKSPWYFQSCKATSLTVFTDNSPALSWYLKLGYKIHPNSPQDKHLRSGKVVKPDYYILIRSCI
ncbi:histone-specific N-acetyltransferase NAT4 [Scheffersomyces xylosifermentans]|uniref:histone-specific N-acetyltransferase NAT4 n=1 Tax=Scheffersomyces xylosifermentans TaxID=1304137 RepID=UPI00315D2DD6